MSAAPCSCEEAEALKARVLELESTVAFATTTNRELTARVAEVEAERDAALREALEHVRGYEGAQVTIHELKQEKESAWNAAIMTAATAVEDTDIVEAKPGYGGSYYAQLGDAAATRAACAAEVRSLRSRAAVTPGSGGGLGDGTPPGTPRGSRHG